MSHVYFKALSRRLKTLAESTQVNILIEHIIIIIIIINVMVLFRYFQYNSRDSAVGHFGNCHSQHTHTIYKDTR